MSLLYGRLPDNQEKLCLLLKIIVRTMSGMEKRGRPSKPKGTTKEEYLELRLDAAEKQAFWDAASLSGMALSVWVRSKLRKAAQRELEDAGHSVAFL
ncbi:MAG: hypothetical protein M3O30_16640 [Planctomycetota bacterium]|nr:hypothetical protein [Planctomycetota bacterium]